MIFNNIEDEPYLISSTERKPLSSSYLMGTEQGIILNIEKTK